MNKKAIGLVMLALGCGLTAWFVGRQFVAKPAGAVADSATSGPVSTAKLKPIAGTTPIKAPSNPVHEKAFLEEQLKEHPDHAPILVRLGEMEFSDGKLPDAKQHLEKAIQIDPTLIDARLELSMVYYQMDDAVNAEKQNREVLKQDPKQGDALYNLGAIYANRKQYAEARQFWNDAVKFAGDTASGKNAASALTKIQ